MHDSEPLILITESNRAIGTGPKLAVHTNGLLHRAFSIFLVDPAGRILLQRRQSTKYHSAGLWANTCCGHPRPGETTHAAAVRRLHEEMAVSADLTFRFHVRYRASVGAGMYENELAYLYFGRIQGQPQPNPEEVSDAEFLPLSRLHDLCRTVPGSYAVWLRHYLATRHHEIALAVGDMSRSIPAAKAPNRTIEPRSAPRGIRP
jgi:isopentenyl-diphosphate Delta-isomerase